MKRIPTIISGAVHNDDRGNLYYNNDFDASLIKRIYSIENENTIIRRGWQGHKIEQRWFSAVQGGFIIALIKIDNWEFPSINLPCIKIQIESKTLDVLHIPKGYVSCIQAIREDSKLLVMADYLLGEIKDDYRFNLDYFENKI